MNTANAVGGHSKFNMKANRENKSTPNNEYKTVIGTEV